MPPYRGVLFDLFGTLVTFDPTSIPEIEIDGRRLRSTIGALEDALREWVPGTRPEAFMRALMAVSDEMARERTEHHLELPSRERFRRALERLGCDRAQCAEAAVYLSRAHMALIAQATAVPAPHTALLASLRPRYRLGLVSNFDCTATAYDILVRHDIIRYLDTVVISEAVGLRKPHPAPLRAALRGLGLGPSEVLFVGDNFGEDIAGAHAAGIDAAWLDTRGEDVPAGKPPPRYVLPRLDALASILA